ncbi:ABC transporter substrate-binding protein [Geovibrio thiophilus]|nr:ABC transporter substrate-binding protein [Geovibrio thiophilus]
MKYPIIITITLILLTSCKKDDTPVRIGVNGWPPCEIWYVAQQQGYFGDVPVQIVRFSAWTDNMKSLYLGNTDITHATYFNALYFLDKGEQAKIVLSSDTIDGGDGLTVKNGISSVSELRGKTIAVEINTDEHFLLYKTLKQAGISLSDVNLLNSSAADGRDHFINNEADAVYTYEPYLSQAASNGGGKIISTAKELPGYMTDTLMASQKLINDRPEEIKTIITAWYKAQAYILANPEESFGLMAANEKMTPEDFAAFYRSFRFFTAEENRSIPSSENFVEVVTEIADFLGIKHTDYENIAVTDFLP